MSYRHGSSDHRRDSSRVTEGWAYEHPRSGPHYGHSAAPQAAPAARPAPKRRRFRAADYTLIHAGRQVRLGPVAFWVVVGTLVIMAGWSVVTGTYFAFHDDVIKRLIARQAQMQFAYEDRIAELRGQVDRITSRQLLDQEQFEQKLEQLVRKQAALEQRTSAIANLGGDSITTGSIKSGARHEPVRMPKPSPISDTVIFSAPPDREARLESRPSPFSLTAFGAKRARSGLAGQLARVNEALDRVAARQMSTLGSIEEGYDSKVRRMRGVLADLGIDAGKAPAPAPIARKGTSATGGPFIAATARGDSLFERQLYRISLARTQTDHLKRKMTTVPVEKPIFGKVDMSSPFGMRMDPFVRGPAIHSGIDMRGDSGDPVRATANGTVTVAGRNGGYGNMVEIDHGGGLTTRYGHLSAIGVKVGQKVRLGQTIGKIGSTGRSTGPHLHYETRVNGDAVDPQKFLRAGLRLDAS